MSNISFNVKELDNSVSITQESNSSNISLTANTNPISAAVVFSSVGIKGDPGASDYTELTSIPSLNGVTITGNKTLADYGLERLTNTEIEAIFNS